MNALGFVDRPLYLFPEFMATKPVEILIREGLKAEDFNDDVLGEHYRASTGGIFMQIAANAYGEYSGHFLHNDTTSMSLQGAYEHERGVKQRWVVVFPEKAFGRETKTLEKKIKKENREGNVEKRKFIVATNELDSEQLSDEEVKAYKCVAEPNINSHHLLQTHIQHLLRLSCKRVR